MSARQRWVVLAAQLRAEGKPTVDIAGALRERFGIGALAALRYARGWSQEQAAQRWTDRWPTKPKTYKDFSDWETGRHTPALDTFDHLAQLYQCDLADLLADRPGYRPHGRTAQPAPGSPRRWRASTTTASDLETLVESYRRTYGGEAAVDELLPCAVGVLHLLDDLGKRERWPGSSARLASMVGQAALLAGLLHLMGPRDLATARTCYDTALEAAQQAEDWDLASYVLGSLAFHSTSAGRPSDARAYRDAAWGLACGRATPRTTAWVAALVSELYARDGDAAASRQFLDKSAKALDKIEHQPAWKGVGWFDQTRLTAYEGGNLVLLGRYAEAEDLLRHALEQLDASRLKHRCTLSADLAMALAHQTEIDEACSHASDALALATSIRHQESINRVRRVHARLLQWDAQPAVVQLTEQLHTATTASE